MNLFGRLFTFLVILFFWGCSPDSPENLHTGFFDDRIEDQIILEQRLLGMHEPEVYREHLYQLTLEPHIAGTPESERVIRYLGDVMSAAGLTVDNYDYDVYLAQPGEVEIEIITPEQITLPNRERIYEEDPYTADERLLHGWNAYSGSGEVTAEVVYANYGRKEDFKKLQEMGVSVEGKIVIARYGGNFRGFKAMYAEQHDAVGLIMYIDPANGGFSQGDVYPNGRFADDSAIQRGSLLTLDYYGDPLTPFEPSLPLDGDVQVDRLDPSEVDFHTIPVAPVGYGAANEILSRMDGDTVPADWQGGFEYDYALTGGSGLTVRLMVDQPFENQRITNVIGTIEGSEFPDEWIILGSHHDAWSHGATDPNSGTAMLLTLAESLGELVREGYRPKRSIMIGHWDAEEFMLIGSSEWVEHLYDELQASAILYLNADMSVTGPNFRASSSPSLKKPILDAAKSVMHPVTGQNLFHYWAEQTETNPPVPGNLGGGSDHVPFYMHAGIPSAAVAISGWVPIYHTSFDTFHYYETFIDEHFHYGPALADVYGLVALRFANADILPYDIESYAKDIILHFEGLSDRDSKSYMKAFDSEILRDLENQVNQYLNLRDTYLAEFSSNGAAPLDEINRLLIGLERNFLHEDGLPFSKWLRSLYAAPDPYSGYASWMFPSYMYAIEEQFNADDFSELHAVHEYAIGNLISDMRQINTRLSTMITD